MKNVHALNPALNMKGLLVLSLVPLVAVSALPDLSNHVHSVDSKSLGVVEAVKKEAELQKKKFIIPPETTQIGLEDAIVGAEPRSGRDLEDAEDRKGRDLGDKKKNIAKKKKKVESRDIKVVAVKEEKNDWERFLEPPYMPASVKTDTVRKLYNDIIREEVEEKPKANFDTAPWQPMDEHDHKHGGHHQHKDEVRVKKETKLKLKNKVRGRKPVHKAALHVHPSQHPNKQHLRKRPLPKPLANIKRPAVVLPKLAPLKKLPPIAIQKPKAKSDPVAKVNNKKVNAKVVPKKKLSRPLSKPSKKHLKQTNNVKLHRPVPQRSRKVKAPQKQNVRPQRINPKPQQKSLVRPAPAAGPAPQARTVPSQKVPKGRSVSPATNIRGRSPRKPQIVRTVAPISGRRLLPNNNQRQAGRPRSLRVPIKARKQVVRQQKPVPNRREAKKTKLGFKPLSSKDATTLGVGTLVVGSLLAL